MTAGAYAPNPDSLQRMIAARFPKVSSFRIDDGRPNIQPVEYDEGGRLAREYPPVARWIVGEERFSYVLKPKFKVERWGVLCFTFGGTTTKIDYTPENETLLKLLQWSSDGKTAAEMNRLLDH